MELLSHQVTIEHRKSTEHEGPDVLSRMYEYEGPEDWAQVKDKLQELNTECIHIQISNWYDLKKTNVRKNPENYAE